MQKKRKEKIRLHMPGLAAWLREGSLSRKLAGASPTRVSWVTREKKASVKRPHLLRPKAFGPKA
eukprot:1161656-Pelagomonas_calceolata.AAC.9